jgi:hypothetical protein
MPAPQEINNFYADSHPRPITPKESEAATDGQPLAPVSFPDSPGDCLQVEMTLFEYGMFLETLSKY